MSHGIACPICGSNDQSQKVSAIVMAGTQSYQASGPTVGTALVGNKMGLATSFTRVSGTNQTAIATMLMPPEKPKKPNAYQVDPPGLFLAMVFTVLAFLAMAATQGINVGVLAFGGAEILMVLRVHGKINAAYNQQVLPPWQKAVDRWNRLYYCFRDDVVYDPETGKSCPPSQMYTLLYD